jgi:hypothetical protein
MSVANNLEFRKTTLCMSTCVQCAVRDKTNIKSLVHNIFAIVVYTCWHLVEMPKSNSLWQQNFGNTSWAE